MTTLLALLSAPDAESISLNKTKPTKGAKSTLFYRVAPLVGFLITQAEAFSLRRAPRNIILSLVLIFLSISVIHAQRNVTQDEVNAVAERMYCPVCENIPLDDCGTATCQAWKDEIRQQLAAGQSAQTIIDEFVRRYGEQVVGIPQDPALRGLSLITPWLLVIVALGVGVWTFRRWQATPEPAETAPAAAADINPDAYRNRIEQDVS